MCSKEIKDLIYGVIDAQDKLSLEEEYWEDKLEPTANQMMIAERWNKHYGINYQPQSRADCRAFIRHCIIKAQKEAESKTRRCAMIRRRNRMIKIAKILGKGRNCIPVYQYDLKGNYVCCFPSLTDAANANNYSIGSMWRSITKRKLNGGHRRVRHEYFDYIKCENILDNN